MLNAQNIIGTNLLTKFHEDQKINVASRVHIKKNAPPPGSHVFQPTGIIFELIQDIIWMNLLTKFHEDQTANVASRVLTRFCFSHIRKNAPPLGSHFFQANIIIFELIQDIIETDLLTKFHEDLTINKPTRIPTPNVLPRCAPGLVMGPCIAEIDRIVIREVHHQLEVNWCRNKEVIGAPGLVIVPCIVEIDRIVIREVQYQFEVNRCRNEEIIVKGNFGRVWSMWAGPQVEIDPNVIREVQYQFEVNPCRNEKIIVNGIFWWVWPMWAGAPGLGLGPCIYQFEVNPCRNEKIIVNGNFWWVWPMWAGRPRIDRIVIREVQYQFEVNRWARGMVWVRFQGSSAFSVGGDSGQDGRTERQTDRRTDGRTAEITTISPPFFQKAHCRGIVFLTNTSLPINVASRVKNAPPLGSHTNLLTKFHEDWTINVASRELTSQMLTPHNARRTKGDHKSSP
ncbi:hypothetical protein DPMN_100345 [Dreissena polymorpha]|uniref:Uncharacterized protein n=1 Tax=Dreissena polymorpha TaxID=45954 RepID=A0A9D4R8L2_DREPO|nr:hypothetical protein DPMN_100345 [Dreissena polymorpha]